MDTLQSPLQSLILGLIQAAGEFLPISSSAHLILCPWMIGWPEHSLTFDVALHVGTLLAVLVYFFNDIIKLIKGFLAGITNRNMHINEDSQLAWYILIATIPGAVIGYFLQHYAEETFRNPLLIAGTLIFFACLLGVADRFGSKNKGADSLNTLTAFLIGIAQSIAVIPGVSRSGATITLALFLGLNRYVAARFSFLVSIPIIAGAAIIHIKRMLIIPNHSVLIGIATSFIAGILIIKFLLQFIQTKSYLTFVAYRIILSVVIIAFWFYKPLV